MKVENIEEMVRVIHGSFPNSDIFKPDVVKAWQRNSVIQNMEVEQARTVQVNIVNTCDRFPSVNEVVAMYYKLFGKTVLKCDRCYSSGWIQQYDKDGEYATVESDVPALKGIKYRYVIQCPSCNK